MTETEKQELRVKVAWFCPTVIRYRKLVVGGIWEYRDSLFGWLSCRNNDPLSDLNACAEFEKTLTHEQCERYHAALEDIQAEETQGRNGEQDYPAQDFWFHATATQRCQAFVSVMEEKR